jgi:hypothetical protein
MSALAASLNSIRQIGMNQNRRVSKWQPVTESFSMHYRPPISSAVLTTGQSHGGLEKAIYRRFHLAKARDGFGDSTRMTSIDGCARAVLAGNLHRNESSRFRLGTATDAPQEEENRLEGKQSISKWKSDSSEEQTR